MRVLQKHRLFFLTIIASAIMVNGKCKKSACGEFNRQMKVLITVGSYVRSLTFPPNCVTIQERYGINSFSDALGCDGDWMGQFGQNIYRDRPANDYFYGWIEILTEDKKSCKLVFLHNPGNDIKCNNIGQFEGKVPTSGFKMVITIWEPCFRSNCRGSNYPRTMWQKVIEASPGTAPFEMEYRLDEHREGDFITAGLCY